MIKKILLILAIIFVFLGAGLLYVNKILLPVQIKGMILTAAEEQLHRKVTFDRLYFHPLKGIVITDIHVVGKDTPEDDFLSIKEASARVLLLPLLKKNIVVSSVRIDSPSLRLVRFEPTLWNFSDMIKPSAAQGSEASKGTNQNQPPSLVIREIAITNGRLKVTDRSQMDEFTEVVEPINIQGALSLSTEVKISGSLAIPATQGTLRVHALYSFKNGDFKSDVAARNIFAARYLRFAPPLPLAVRDFSIATADLSVSGNDKSVSVSGSGSFPSLDFDPVVGAMLKAALSFHNLAVTVSRDGTATLKGDITATGVTAKSSDGKSFEGNLRASIEKSTVSKPLVEFNGNLDAEDVRLNLDPSRALRGTVHARDIHFSMPNGRITASGAIEAKNLALKLDNAISVLGDLSLPSVNVTPTENGLTAKGDIRLSKAVVSLAKDQKIAGNLSLSKMTVTVNGQNIIGRTDLALSDLKVIMPNTLTAESDVNAAGLTFSYKDGAADINAQIDLKKLHALANKTISVTGAPVIALHVGNDPSRQPTLSWAGTVDLNSLEVTGLPTVGTLSELDGRIAFATDQAQTKNLSFSALGTHIKVSGEVESFAAPQLNLDVATGTIDLASLDKVVPAIKEQELKLSGNATLSAHVEGKAADLLHAKVRAKAELTNASVESAKLKQKADQISGLITYETPTLLWKDLTIGYQGKTWVMNGYLQDFATPFAAGSLKTTDLQADYQIRKNDDKIKIERLTGSYFDSTFDLTGSVRLAPQSEPQAQPTFDVSGDVKLALKDLPKILPAEQVKLLEPMELVGILKIKADIKGQPTNWMDWASTIVIDASTLYVKGYEFENLKVKAVQKNGVVDPLTIDGDFYEGVIRETSSLDLKKAGFPFKTTFKLDSTNLEKLKRVTPLKDRKLEGLFTCEANVSGKAVDLQSLAGTASFDIKDGYLFDVPGLSILGEILQSSAKTGDITSLKSASATLQIEDGRATTNDLHIKGSAVDIQGQGWVGLDQTMDMTFKTTFLSATQTNATASVISAIDPTGELTSVRLYGPLSNPKREFQATNLPKLIPNVLKNTADSILKLFQ